MNLSDRLSNTPARPTRRLDTQKTDRADLALAETVLRVRQLVRSVLLVSVVLVALVALSTLVGRAQAVELVDCDDCSQCDAAAADEIEPPPGTAPPSPDLSRCGLQSEPPLPAGRTAVQDVFRPPTR